MHKQYLLDMPKLCGSASEQTLLSRKDGAQNITACADASAVVRSLGGPCTQDAFAMQSGSARNEQRRDELKQHASTVQRGEHTSQGGIGPRRFLSARGPGSNPALACHTRPDLWFFPSEKSCFLCDGSYASKYNANTSIACAGLCKDQVLDTKVGIFARDILDQNFPTGLTGIVAAEIQVLKRRTLVL